MIAYSDMVGWGFLYSANLPVTFNQMLVEIVGGLFYAVLWCAVILCSKKINSSALLCTA